MKYHIFLVTIVLCFFIFVICGKECGVETGGKKKCCAGYRNVYGICTECAEGSYGEECQRSCPRGKYGVACSRKCNCKKDQICDAKDGCVYNNTESTIEIVQTTSTDQQTSDSTVHYERVHWKYLFGFPFGVLMTVLILLSIHIRRKRKLGDEANGLHDDQQDQGAEYHAIQENQNAVYSDYAEVCELDAPYSHTLTFSSDYNELSFSRSRRNRSESRPTETHYDTSKNCTLKIKESECDVKLEEEGNPYSLAGVVDTEKDVQ